MKHRLNLSVISFVAAGLLAFSAPAVTGQSLGDFQIWNETTLLFPVIKETDKDGKESDKLSLLVLGVLRLGQNRLYPVDARIGAGFDLKLNKYWSFTPTYVYRRGEPVNNAKEFEHRLRFDVTVGNKWKNFSLKDRSRVEYRIRHNRDDSVRYRNKFTYAFPVRHNKKEILSPFVSEEVYYDITAKEFSTNEIQAGISRKLSKNVSADFFYIRRDVNSGAIRNINGIGTNIKIRID
ncbi:MAG: DUF2490 domain-containing protein [Pyrinomonadaceae bacterium]